MPGARLESFRHGDRAERLAEFVLSGFAFTTAVPRQEDVGHDFHCVLTVRGSTQGMLQAGPSFSVQVKSKLEPVAYTKPHETDWIAEQENPFFLCVVDRRNLRCDMYSTWNRLNGFTMYGRPPTVLIPGDPIALPVKGADGVLRIPLGPPVLSFTVTQAMREDLDVESILRPWIELDRVNITNSRAGMHWVEGPETWTTSEPPEQNTLQRFYWNAKNLRDCIDTAGRSTVALLLTSEHARSNGLECLSDEAMALLGEVVATLGPHMNKRTVDLYDRGRGKDK